MLLRVRGSDGQKFNILNMYVLSNIESELYVCYQCMRFRYLGQIFLLVDLREFFFRFRVRGQKK